MYLNAEEKTGNSVKSEQIYTTLGFGEDISIKIEKQFLLKSATTAFRSLWFSSSKSKRKIKPFRN